MANTLPSAVYGRAAIKIHSLRQLKGFVLRLSGAASCRNLELSVTGGGISTEVIAFTHLCRQKQKQTTEESQLTSYELRR